LWLWTVFLKQTQPNPRLAQGAGHYIMTNPFLRPSRPGDWVRDEQAVNRAIQGEYFKGRAF
jgi:hypothetical protein